MNQQEKIRILEMELEAWTDEAVNIFSRHRTACSKKEDGSPSKSVSKEEELAEHSQMIQLNNRVNMFLKAFQNRLIGENGTASALVNVANGLESWYVYSVDIVHTYVENMAPIKIAPSLTIITIVLILFKVRI